MRKLHLICNAHLDPIWMWEKDEGIAEVLSTYRVAADFCKDYDGFVFNHNESILYEWVEEYDPALFKEIQTLVAEGKWHIMGGFYLQPDCNMPSGEAMVRQALIGIDYFKEKFNVRPKTVINFDSFGHSRGLVQISKKLGYDSYIACRPLQSNCPVPADDFVWVGFDGSEILFHRGYNSYESHRGKADIKIKGFIDTYPEKEIGLVLWGIGNHGGGPSRIDYEKIEALKQKVDIEIVDSYPEAYFAEIDKTNLPKVYKSMNYHSVGCYTSQIRIKQKYRELENLLFKVEKMVSAAVLSGGFEYPDKELKEAEKDLAFIQFHDILPGSSIKSAEEAAIRQTDHGLEILERLKIKSFLSLMRGAKKANDGDIPIFVYNPHPVKTTTIVECEFNLPDQNTDKNKWAFPRVYKDGKQVPCQVLHEESNFNVDWRKRITFEAELLPSQMNRFDCVIEFWDKEPEKTKQTGDKICFDNGEIKVEINCNTGAIDKYMVGDKNYLKEGSFIPMVMEDDYDSWGNTRKDYKVLKGNFKLLDDKAGSQISGIDKPVKSVRVIEDGDVLTVVEAVFGYSNSFACVRYHLPKKGTELKITVNVLWNECMCILKLPVKTTLEDSKYIGQVMYGAEELATDGMEVVSQKYSVVSSQQGAVSIINIGSYGSDFEDGEVKLSLLRSPGYSAGCSDFSRRKPEVMEQDRFNRFIDQGERNFTYWFNFGDTQERLLNIEKEAAFINEAPFALSCFPTGDENIKQVSPLIILDNESVQMTAFKKAINSDNFIIRLFEPTGTKQPVKVTLPMFNIEKSVEINSFEIITLELDLKTKTISQVSLDESR